MTDKSRKVFSPLDREIFREVLRTHASVIENKKTDAFSNKAKEAAWVEIAKQFNGCTRISENRTAPQLKKLWQNMKTAARDQKTKQRQNTFATGGGPADEVDTSIIDEVDAIAPHLMISVTPAIDSDFLPVEQTAVVNSITELREVNPEEEIISMSEVVLVDNPSSIVPVLISECPEDNSGEDVVVPSKSSSITSGSSSVSFNTKPGKIHRRRNTSGSSWTSFSESAKQESDKRSHRQTLVAEQDQELFAIEKAIALTELSAAEVRLQSEKLKKELLELELRQKKQDMGLE